MTQNTFGLSSQDWSIFEQIAIQQLNKNNARIWIFGSRARGDHKKFSDLDVLYEFNGQPPEGLISSIKEGLEESDISIKVDMVHKPDLAKSYSEQVERDKVLL